MTQPSQSKCTAESSEQPADALPPSEKIAEKSQSVQGLHVQYGCGPFSGPPEWVNFDASLTLRFERIPLIGRLYTKNAQRFPENAKYGDIVKGLPLPEQSCAGIYASHVLEHLTLDHFHVALENTKRILRPGGIFRVLVPDLEAPAAVYLQRLKAGDPTASHFFMNATNLGRPLTRPGIIGLVHRAFATSFHYWMWDSASLTTALIDHGFKQIRPCRFGDCEDTLFNLAEEEKRFADAVALEARL